VPGKLFDYSHDACEQRNPTSFEHFNSLADDHVSLGTLSTKSAMAGNGQSLDTNRALTQVNSRR